LEPGVSKFVPKLDAELEERNRDKTVQDVFGVERVKGGMRLLGDAPCPMPFLPFTNQQSASTCICSDIIVKDGEAIHSTLQIRTNLDRECGEKGEKHCEFGTQDLPSESD
jgi:hypothetical protein